MKLKHPQKDLHILLADDDNDDCYFFEEACSNLSQSAVLKTVSDGERLMAYLLSNTNSLPDILFLDLNMPRKNGFECLRSIKKMEALKKIPVVICSTACDHHLAEKLYKEGAHYYLQKSDVPVLKQGIEQVLLKLKINHRQPPWNEFLLPLQKI